MTVYLDVILIENVLMNYIILFGVGQILKIKMKNVRLIISSTLGAIYAVISYIGIIPIYSNIFMKILLSLMIVYIAFIPNTVKTMLKTLLLFYLISFVTGGCAFALLYIVSPNNVAFRNGVLVGTYPMKITLIAGAVGFLIIQYSFAINKKMLKHKDLLCDLKIKICGKTIQTKAFLDSGNSLKEPITGKPVIIIEKRELSKIIDLNKIENFEGGDENLHISIIPFKSIGNQNGIMLGIKSEYVKIKFEDEILQRKNVILGICEKRIGKHYSALVGLDLLERREEHNESNYSFKKTLL